MARIINLGDPSGRLFEELLAALARALIELDVYVSYTGRLRMTDGLAEPLAAWLLSADVQAAIASAMAVGHDLNPDCGSHYPLRDCAQDRALHASRALAGLVRGTKQEAEDQ